MRFTSLTLGTLLLAGCAPGEDPLQAGNGNGAVAQAETPRAPDGRPFVAQPVGQFDEPWAMTFISEGAALVTEKPGRMWIWHPRDGSRVAVRGVPQVDAGGQGGLGDIVPHPDFARNNLVYLSWVEAGEGDTRGAVVGRAELVIDNMGDGDAELRNLQIIWRQQPKVTGRGHFAHRLAFSPDGRHLFITSGDRQKLDPAQDNSQHLGTIVRLTADGQTPPDNPFAGQGPVQAQIWSYGHRNQLGIAFDASGNLWSHEMGPRHGDEFNLILRGRNYGWPVVSNGEHYDGGAIPDHDTRPDFEAPRISWVPAVSPAGMIIYSGDMFPQWRGSAFLGGLSGQTLVRVAIDGTSAREAERWDMGARIREVEQGPNGEIYVLEDTRGGSGGRLLRLTPPR